MGVEGVRNTPWYLIALLICLVIGPFDALYIYIKSERRKEALRKRREESGRATDDLPQKRERK